MVCSAELHLVTTTAQGEEALLLPGYVVCCFICQLSEMFSELQLFQHQESTACIGEANWSMNPGLGVCCSDN